MEKIIKGLGKGLLIGLCIGLIGSLIVGCDVTAVCVEEWIGAFFGCGSCSKGCSGYWGDKSVQNCYLFALLISTVVGGVYGVIGAIQDNALDKKIWAEKEKDNAQKQRQNRASEIKQKALNVNNICIRNKSLDMPLVATTYKANDQMDAIITELIKVAEKQGKIEALAEELLKNGDNNV